jgi:hypothetical protein
MDESQSNLQGTDWFSRLKNPQGSGHQTSTAEGLSDKKPEPQEQNVDLPE